MAPSHADFIPPRKTTTDKTDKQTDMVWPIRRSLMMLEGKHYLIVFIPLPSYHVFRDRDDLTFTLKTISWGVVQPVTWFCWTT